MAHSAEIKQAVRSSYIYERLSLSACSLKHAVSFSSVQSWKRKAKANGDDWDKARAASRLADGGLGDITQQLLEDFALLFQSTIDDIKNGDFNGLEKAEAISRLSDSYNKTMRAASGGNPKIAKLAVALQVLEELVAFIQKEYPEDLPRFAVILEAIQPRVSEVFA